MGLVLRFLHGQQGLGQGKQRQTRLEGRPFVSSVVAGEWPEG